MSEQRGRVRVEAGHKRVRAYLDGEAVVDTTTPLLVWEIPYYPAYYVPVADVRADLLVPNGRTEHSPSRGEAQYFTATTGGREVADAAWQYPDSPIEELRDHVRLDWKAMDSWFEEDEEVFIHPRDPHSRVDVLHSSRHVEVHVDGVKIADTTRPTLLFETGLPVRYYVPQTDVRMDLLTPTDTETGCPYKGFAHYWTVDTGAGTHEDVAWSYRSPFHESHKIAGLVSFYNEKVDLVVDGVAQERPRTPFS
jgi:uncharacterized protein (DUF427 family)